MNEHQNLFVLGQDDAVVGHESGYLRKPLPVLQCLETARASFLLCLFFFLLSVEEGTGLRGRPHRTQESVAVARIICPFLPFPSLAAPRESGPRGRALCPARPAGAKAPGASSPGLPPRSSAFKAEGGGGCTMLHSGSGRARGAASLQDIAVSGRNPHCVWVSAW